MGVREVLVDGEKFFVFQDGSEKVTEQVRVTPKGLTKLALVFQEAI